MLCRNRGGDGLWVAGVDREGPLTEDRVAQHLVFVRRLAQERVGDGAGRVGEARQVRSGCQRVDGQRVGPRAWRTDKTFTTTFWVSES